MNDVTEETTSVIEQVGQYAKTNAELYTLRVTGKMARVVSSLTSRLIILALVFVFFFIACIGLALWIGERMGHAYAGFFIVAAGGAAVALILYLFRYALIRKPVMNSFISQVLQ